MPLGDGSFPKAEIYDGAARRDRSRRSRAGRDVAVLCEGDPFFYGSFMYLYARLARALRGHGRARRVLADGLRRRGRRAARRAQRRR